VGLGKILTIHPTLFCGALHLFLPPRLWFFVEMNQEPFSPHMICFTSVSSGFLLPTYLPFDCPGVLLALGQLFLSAWAGFTRGLLMGYTDLIEV